MKNKIALDTERMKGFGRYNIDGFEVNYLFGLNDLCEKYVKNNFTILELGSNDGVSTSLFSFFARMVVCVDINKSPSMVQVISKYDNIIFHNTSFKSFLENDTNNQYDLIYIDGGHNFEDINEDIELFKSKVKSGGYISGHDCNSDTPGVRLAIEKHFPDKEIILFSDSSWLIKMN